jgi:ankyrin repeat protein
MKRIVKYILDNQTFLLEEFLLLGGNPDSIDEKGYSLLHWACQESMTDCIEILARYNADLNIENKHGMTPLYNASGENNTNVVNKLLDLGADINKKTNLGTALHNACAYECIDVVMILLLRGAYIDVENKEGLKPIDLVEKPSVIEKLINKQRF